MKWAYGGLAAAILIVGGAFFLMKGPAGSSPPTLFQWQDYVDPHFTAAYEAATTKKSAPASSPTRTKPSPRCAPASSRM